MNETRKINFLRAIKKSGVHAAEFINEKLDEGLTLEEIFKKGEIMGMVTGYFLNVKKLDLIHFDIEFGCVAGPDAGDGGNWIVVFNDEDEVVSCEGGGSWIS